MHTWGDLGGLRKSFLEDFDAKMKVLWTVLTKLIPHSLLAHEEVLALLKVLLSLFKVLLAQTLDFILNHNGVY